MQSLVVAILVAVAVVSAEPPRPSSRQTSLDGPYPPSGWKPSGRLLQLPVRNNNLQEYGAPQTLYGPPKNESDVETTTENGTEPTTIDPESENVPAPTTSAKLQAKKSDKSTAQPNQYFFIVPQSQKLVFSAPLRVVGSEPRRQPAPARLEEYPQVVQFEQVPVQAEQAQAVPVQYEQLQTVPVLSGYVSQSSVLTPYSSSFVQIYQ